MREEILSPGKLRKIPFFVLIITALVTISFSSNVFGAITVNGVVLDERRFPVPDVTVQINGAGKMVTDSEGRFSIRVLETPYTLSIIDNSHSRTVIYKGLTTDEPELRLFGAKTGRNANTEVLKVNFTQISSGHSATIKFLSSDLFHSESVSAASGEGAKLLTIDWPKGNDRINGRVLYLEKTSAGFTKYIEQYVTVYKDYPVVQVIDFNTETHFIDPGETSIMIYLPILDYDRKGFSVYADFLSLNRNADILLSKEEANIVSTKVLVPKTLPLSFRLKVSGNGYYSDNEGFVNYTYSYPGSTLNISSETPPKILAPQNRVEGVSSGTKFSYETGSGVGIYVVHFHSLYPEGDYYIVTTEKSVSSPVSGGGGGIDKRREYQWYVSKYISYISVDDFVRPETFANDLGYKAITYSERRTFKTSY